MERVNSMHDSWSIQCAASDSGFDWPDISGVLEKVKEEVAEIEKALRENNHEQAREELGDLFFASVNLARFLDAHPCDVMESANEKFLDRFERVQAIVATRNLDMKACTLEELDEIWGEVKQGESPRKK